MAPRRPQQLICGMFISLTASSVAELVPLEGQFYLLQTKTTITYNEPHSSSSSSHSSEDAGLLGLSVLLEDLDAGCSVHQPMMDDRKHRLARSLPSDRKPVLWVHLHNFAGTFICEEAMHQGELGPPNSYTSWPGCLMPGDDCSTTGQSRSLCEDRARSPYTFTAVERDVEEKDFCDQLLVGTMLRNPLAGVQSTLLANTFDKAALLDVLRTGKVHEVPHKPCLPDWDTYQHFDNFATRSLGGGYEAPPRGVTREHLERAKERLRRMDVVLILEELRLHLPQLSAVLGWDTAHLDSGRKSHGHNCRRKEAVLTANETEFLTSLNALDFELYEYANELADNLTAAAAHRS